MDRAQQFLRDEIRRLEATDLVISTNIPVRKDGGLYHDYMRYKMDDPGVAIFFKYKGKPTTMCCDRYNRVWENIYALGKGIEAIRGMERWGISEFIERAFTGFKAIPEKVADTDTSWWTILETQANADYKTVRDQYRKLAGKYHPDNRETGSAEKFIQVQKAFEQVSTMFMQ